MQKLLNSQGKQLHLLNLIFLGDTIPPFKNAIILHKKVICNE